MSICLQGGTGQGGTGEDCESSSRWFVRFVECPFVSRGVLAREVLAREVLARTVNPVVAGL